MRWGGGVKGKISRPKNMLMSKYGVVKGDNSKCMKTMGMMIKNTKIILCQNIILSG